MQNKISRGDATSEEWTEDDTTTVGEMKVEN